MLPTFTTYNGRNGELANVMLFCQFHLSIALLSVILSDLCNFALGQLRCGTVLSTRSSSTTFLIHIPDVLDLATEPQVVRINAKRIVSSGAVMKNALLCRNISEVDKPTCPMSKFHPVARCSSVDKTVTASIDCGCPEPTRIGFAYLCPKPVYEGQREPAQDQQTGRNCIPFLLHSS